MRKAPTRSEALLWAQLRGRKCGVRFRRQHPIDRFIVDFFAPCARLVVEAPSGAARQRRVAKEHAFDSSRSDTRHRRAVDGAVHGSAEWRRYDAVRTSVLERDYGLRVLRLDAGLVERDVLAAVTACVPRCDRSMRRAAVLGVCFAAG